MTKYINIMLEYSKEISNGQLAIVHLSQNILLTGILIILFSVVAGIIISYILDLYGVKIKSKPDESNERKVGRSIGIIERLLIIIFIMNNQYGAMGFILAGKSLARYQELSDKSFAEYYLLGTFLSFLLGISGGLIINYIQ